MCAVDVHKGINWMCFVIKQNRTRNGRKVFQCGLATWISEYLDNWILGMCAKLLQSCLTLCDAMDHSWLGFSAHGILQTRILEWVAMLFSRGSSWPGIEPPSLLSPTLQAGSLPLAPPRKPLMKYILREMIQLKFATCYFLLYLVPCCQSRYKILIWSFFHY